jgi:hypothetical protein
MFQIKVAEKIKNTHFMLKSVLENRAVYEIMWKNIVEPDRPQTKYGAGALHAGYLRIQTYT